MRRKKSAMVEGKIAMPHAMGFRDNRI